MKQKLKNILIADNIVSSISNNLDILLDIIPEINDMIGFEHKHPHHHLDVWNHTLLALSLSPKDFEIRLVLLLHDIGKPHCYQDLQIRRFNGHPEKSCQIANNILNRLNFNQDEIQKICYLVKSHDNMISKSLIKADKELAKKLLQIQFCDAMAHNPTKLEKRKKYLLAMNERINIGTEKENFEKLLHTITYNSENKF